MFQAKEKFLDRIEQSFSIYRKIWKNITFPMLVFNIIIFSIIPYVALFIIDKTFPIDDIFANSESYLSNLSLILTYIIAVGVLIGILYILCLIPIQIGVLKTIREVLLGKPIPSILESISYGFGKLYDAFRVYWYIFAYTLLIPALIFIVGGILLNIGLYYNSSDTEIFIILGGILMGISLVSCIFYAIYRGIKASFAMISAVDTEDFYKNTFLDTVSLTHDKWWRIFGNLFGIGIIGGLLIGLLGGIGESIALLGNDWSSIGELETESEELQYIFSSYANFNIFFFINSVIQTFLSTILGVFITVFTYIFYKRLVDESGKTSPNETVPNTNETKEEREL